MNKLARGSVRDKLQEGLRQTVVLMRKHPELLTVPAGALAGRTLASALQEPETPDKDKKKLLATLAGGAAGLGFGRLISDSPLYHRSPRQGGSEAGGALSSAVGGAAGAAKDVLWDDRGPVGKAITGAAALYLAHKLAMKGAAYNVERSEWLRNLRKGIGLRGPKKPLMGMEKVLANAGKADWVPSFMARPGMNYGKIIQTLSSFPAYGWVKSELKNTAKAAKV